MITYWLCVHSFDWLLMQSIGKGFCLVKKLPLYVTNKHVFLALQLRKIKPLKYSCKYFYGCYSLRLWVLWNWHKKERKSCCLRSSTDSKICLPTLFTSNRKTAWKLSEFVCLLLSVNLVNRELLHKYCPSWTNESLKQMDTWLNGP